MRARQTTRPAAVLACIVVTLGAASCDSVPAETGRAPEGTILPSRPTAKRPARPAGASEAAAADDPAGDPARIGVASAHRFHKAGCAELAKVPVADQTTFKSCWEAINADLAPCTECRAGPSQQ